MERVQLSSRVAGIVVDDPGAWAFGCSGFAVRFEDGIARKVEWPDTVLKIAKGYGSCSGLVAVTQNANLVQLSVDIGGHRIRAAFSSGFSEYAKPLAVLPDGSSFAIATVRGLQRFDSAQTFELDGFEFISAFAFDEKERQLCWSGRDGALAIASLR